MDSQQSPEESGSSERQRQLEGQRRRIEAARGRVFRGSSLASAHAADWELRHWTSRLLHRVGEIAGYSGAGLVVALLVLAWAVVGLFSGFPTWWQISLYSVAASATLVMVFVIQHTNERQTAGTQRKLDELIRSSTHADNRLIAVEEAADEDLQALTHLNIADRRQASDDVD